MPTESKVLTVGRLYCMVELRIELTRVLQTPLFSIMRCAMPIRPSAAEVLALSTHPAMGGVSGLQSPSKLTRYCIMLTTSTVLYSVTVNLVFHFFSFYPSRKCRGSSFVARHGQLIIFCTLLAHWQAVSRATLMPPLYQLLQRSPTGLGATIA